MLIGEPDQFPELWASIAVERSIQLEPDTDKDFKDAEWACFSGEKDDSKEGGM